MKELDLYSINKMRIISGKYGSRRFNYKLPNGIRPSTDMARESIFNILDNYLDYNNLKVLDLFSGSGSVGIEFLSRGADFVHFNDKNIHSISYIKKILSDLKATNFNITKTSAVQLLKNNELTYSLIYIDPPYESNEYESVLKILSEKKFIENGGIVIIESMLNKKYNFDYKLIKEKRFSSFIIKIYGNI